MTETPKSLNRHALLDSVFLRSAARVPNAALRLGYQFEGDLFAGARIAVVEQHVLNHVGQFAVQDFEGVGFGHQRNRVALRDPDLGFFVVLDVDDEGTVVSRPDMLAMMRIIARRGEISIRPRMESVGRLHPA
jgi:hypothetical protein